MEYTPNDDITGYTWIQKYSENGGPWILDNKAIDYLGNILYSGSDAYYSPEELAKMIDGNTIKFHDSPRSPVSCVDYKFSLSLYNENFLVFTISYGYRLNNGIPTPYYPKVTYPF